MKPRLILLLLVCFLMVLPIGFAQQTQTQSGKPKMVIEQANYDAGSLYRGANHNLIEHDFIIKNEGTANLEILSAKPG
jgi:hypothetical protein